MNKYYFKTLCTLYKYSQLKLYLKSSLVLESEKKKGQRYKKIHFKFLK